MSSQNIVRIEIECVLGSENRFRFKGVKADGFEVFAIGAAGQYVELFRTLLKRLAEAYPDEDSMPVEVENNRIIG